MPKLTYQQVQDALVAKGYTVIRTFSSEQGYFKAYCNGKKTVSVVMFEGLRFEVTSCTSDKQDVFDYRLQRKISKGYRKIGNFGDWLLLTNEHVLYALNIYSAGGREIMDVGDLDEM